MDVQIQTFIDSMIRTQFADFKGSWGNLHLELSEKTLNDLVKMMLTQKSAIPYLGLVNAATVKGGISMDIKFSI
jgi:hypothetical protein